VWQPQASPEKHRRAQLGDGCVFIEKLVLKAQKSTYKLDTHPGGNYLQIFLDIKAVNMV